MKLRQLNLDDIKVGERFRVDMGDVKRLAASIRDKGVIQPITVDQDLNLIAGGRRYAACQHLEMKKIPAVVRPTEDEIDARECELFENVYRKDMSWQEETNLTKRIHDLCVAKYGEDWSQKKTAGIISKSKSTVADAVELAEAMEHIPEIAEAATADQARKTYKRLFETALVEQELQKIKEDDKKNDFVEAADKHYIVGDFLKKVGTVADGVMHFAEVDPPYGIDLKKQRKDKGEHLDTYNEIPSKDYPKFLKDVARQVYRCLSDNSFCVWWYGPSWHDTVLTTLREVGFNIDPIPAIWYKPGGGVSNNPDLFLARTYEPFFLCKKGNPHIRQRGRGNVFAVPGVPPSQRIHATERPIELIQEILKTLAFPGSRVLIPFLGSGNTLLAAYREGMYGYGYDLSDKHKKAFLVRAAKEEQIAKKED